MHCSKCSKYEHCSEPTYISEECAGWERVNSTNHLDVPLVPLPFVRMYEPGVGVSAGVFLAKGGVMTACMLDSPWSWPSSKSLLAT